VAQVRARIHVVDGRGEIEVGGVGRRICHQYCLTARSLSFAERSSSITVHLTACGLPHRRWSVRIALKIKDFEAFYVYLELQKRLEARLRDVLKAKYDLEVENIPLETPPELKFGELATPIAFELARKLRKAPKVIAQEIVAAAGRGGGLRRI
jgi:hypothetical protein